MYPVFRDGGRGLAGTDLRAALRVYPRPFGPAIRRRVVSPEDFQKVSEYADRSSLAGVADPVLDGDASSGAGTLCPGEAYAQIFVLLVGGLHDARLFPRPFLPAPTC